MRIFFAFFWILINVGLCPESYFYAQDKLDNFTLASEKFNNGDFKSALVYLDRELEGNSKKNVQALILRGDVKRFLDNYSGALNDYDLALKLNNNRYDILLKKAIVFSLLKDYQKSIDNYNLVIGEMPENSTAFCGRGFVKVLKKEYNEALKDFIIALKKDSLSISALLGKVISEEALGDHHNAVIDYKKVFTIDPSLIKKDNAFFDLQSDSFDNIME